MANLCKIGGECVENAKIGGKRVCKIYAKLDEKLCKVSLYFNANLFKIYAKFKQKLVGYTPKNKKIINVWRRKR